MKKLLKNTRLTIGTRFWGKTPEDMTRIRAFVEAGRLIAPVDIAVNGAEDKIGTIGSFPSEAFNVTPWGKFVPALNALVYQAATNGAKYLLLQSAEFPPNAEHIQVLLDNMDAQTLVSGARFADHDFVAKPEETLMVEGCGTSVPWNTCALWNLSHLSLLGFPMAGDAPWNPKSAGVEEFTTIALFQKVYPALTAKLINVPGFGEEWDMSGWDNARVEKHRGKIASKNARPAEQMAKIDFGFGMKILHIG